MARDLTADERVVLAHVVEDPDGWWAHCQNVAGDKAEDHLLAKLNKWHQSYLDAKDDPEYKNRAEREAIERAKPQPPGRRRFKNLEERVAAIEAHLGIR